MTKDEKKIAKGAALSAYAKVRGEMTAAQDALRALEVKASVPLAEVVKVAGPGPHKFVDGKRTLLLTIRRERSDGTGAPVYAVKEQDLSLID